MSEIITEYSEGVLRVALNRPEKKNAMTSGMYTLLADILAVADKDENVRAVLWHGNGDSFTAGNDIEDFQKNPPHGHTSPQALLTEELIRFSKPLVAAVHGSAVGGGTTMLTHCDFVYAAESTRFQLPFINLGLTPEFGSSLLIPARTGHLHAAELFMLGETFSAAHAAELGLVTRVVADSCVLEIATAAADRLAAKPAGALKAHKRLLKLASTEMLRAAVKAEGREFEKRVVSPEAQEAFAAFLGKRAPNFRKAA